MNLREILSQEEIHMLLSDAPEALGTPSPTQNEGDIPSYLPRTKRRRKKKSWLHKSRQIDENESK